ncbi:VirB4 family type IV secretion system protein [Haloarchaeobius iranensis]|uniref:Type IV secretory pathway, VirB4 component n=1 Tax=Haloarchaeobius iranensis TaxID=996166 RepID=A0A1G9UGH6_9EURY|nr:transferase [Haloarchaeobius iranensis]SDM58864.1 Type IV secretory pathway, VirB4 component [Haloarchaeobius iranensis]
MTEFVAAGGALLLAGSTLALGLFGNSQEAEEPPEAADETAAERSGSETVDDELGDEEPPADDDREDDAPEAVPEDAEWSVDGDDDALDADGLDTEELAGETEADGGGLLSKLNPLHWFGDDEPEVEMHELMDEEMEAAAVEGWAAIDEVHDMQADAVAPAAIEWETRAARVGEQWTTTLYISDYPDYPSDGYLSKVFQTTDVEFDLTVHLRPKNQEAARDELRNVADELQVDADLEESVRGNYLQERANEAASTYKAVESGTRVFDQGMYLTVRAENREELEEATRKMRSRLRDDPANLTPKTAICKQDLALQSAAPVGYNEFGRESIALGGAVGAMFASMNEASILEEGGVEFGLHKDTDSPVVVDPFQRDNGYSMFTVGDVGSGKSFGAKQNFVRSIEQSEDRMGIILEPLGNWSGVAEALGAQRITVGGTLGLNPLEIKPTPEHVRETMGQDASPFKEKKDDAMSFLVNYFELRNVELGDRRTTLEAALDHAYERNGITDDVSTHGRDSPTIRTVMDVLEDMVNDPEEYVVRTPEETEKITNDAKWLIDQLRPFEEGGRYANLGKPTEFDFRDQKVVYLDLAQQEGSVGGATSLLMQLLISLVYERAKETEKEVVFSIDEARYIMQDAANLEYLETVFRHHRHHDLSIRLITQTVDEFFQHHESEAILDQIAIKQFHRLDGMDEKWADEFELNHAQMRFVQNAVPGNEETGFSEALLGVDGEWRGIEIHAMPKETAVIDFEPANEDRGSLPGAGASAAEREAEAVEEKLSERVDERSGSAFEFGGTAPE